MFLQTGTAWLQALSCLRLGCMVVMELATPASFTITTQLKGSLRSARTCFLRIGGRKGEQLLTKEPNGVYEVIDP